ncbi:nickel-dependent lactate racemase [Candidatus Latescibacterota bacterium]
MEYQLPYNHLTNIKIPDENIIGVFETSQKKPTTSPGNIIKKALENPIGAPRLSEVAANKKRVLILCDDHTRYTPANIILPHIIDELNRSGLNNNRIQILIASGTHRVMTNNELITKLGKSTVDNFSVEQHLHNVSAELVPTGKIINGVQFFINRRLKDADIIIGVGNIIPHVIKGFSGGSTIIMPGVSGGEDAIGTMHSLSLNYTIEEILGIRNNIVRQLIDEIAREAGLNYIVNTIINNDKEILDVVAGDPIVAHQKGTEIASHVFKVNIPQKADIVIFDAYGSDLDFWQANKSLQIAYCCMKERGVIIMFADCQEGICHNIPEIRQYGFKDSKKLNELHTKKLVSPIISHFLLAVCRIVTENGRCIVVSRGISKKDAEHVGFIHASTPQEALIKAFEIKGYDASIIILKQAGNICPNIKE